MEALKDSLTPLYEQIYDDVLARIVSKEWAAGHRIPTEMELCEIYKVSRITVRKAIDDLVKTGYLVRQRGRGTFVRTEHVENELSKFYSFSETLSKKGMSEKAEILLFEEIVPNENLVEKLGVAQGETAYKITRLRSVDDVPYAVESSYLPASILSGMTAEMVAEKGLYNAMRSLGVTPDRARETFHATSLDGLKSRLLQCDLNAPVMSIDRIAYSGNTVVEWCKSTVRGDFFSYTIELGSI